MYALIIKPRAIKMIKEAYDWYELQKPGLGEEFVEELDGFYQKIEVHPEYFGKIKKNLRQAALKTFPLCSCVRNYQNRSCGVCGLSYQQKSTL